MGNDLSHPSVSSWHGHPVGLCPGDCLERSMAEMISTKTVAGVMCHLTHAERMAAIDSVVEWAVAQARDVVEPPPTPLPLTTEALCHETSVAMYRRVAMATLNEYEGRRWME